ncbi:MAG TPA: DUF2828 family protein, partial [Taishania sp.]|nr:DUF2828 family protein [Taishania sp.]
MSLAAKYAPDQNYKNKDFFNAYFNVASKIFDYNRKEYRQLLSAMRKALNIVEVKMSANRWDRINFENVPSVAHKNYRKAFGKHQPDRYIQYLNAVKSGEKKINAKVLTPVDVVKQYIDEAGNFKVYGIDETLEELWKNLPGKVESNVLPIADTSSSMSGIPMLVSIALSIFCAQRSEGAFKNEVISFNDNPMFHSLEKCKTLRDCITELKKMKWGGSTSITNTFFKLLETAKKNKIKQEEMPKFILLISDMEWNFSSGRNETPLQEIEKEFNDSGYLLPTLIMWDVRHGEQKSYPSQDKQGIFQISGYSNSVLNYVWAVMNGTSLDVVVEILNSHRYSFVDDLLYFKS